MKAFWERKIGILWILLFITQWSPAQIGGVINTYAKITNIDVSNKIITFSNVIDASGGSSLVDFAVGKTVMLIQMKGASIDISNTSIFGSLTSINNAGNYEWAKVIDCPTCTSSQIKLASLNKTYTTTGAVQLVSVPEYVNTTVNSTLTARAWSVSLGRGGIIALSVTNTLTLNADINVNGLGFAGGSASNNDGSCADALTFVNSTGIFGQKGEGITDYPSAGQYGKGLLSNAGGGGNLHNAGGGGGSSYTAGGRGGNGWTGACGYTAGQIYGGLGGVSLSSYYSSSAQRLFMGGGGGGGQQNNSLGGAGGNGGGIIVISANTLTAACNAGSPYGMYANGNNGNSSTGNDGAGGGGGGGSILLQVRNYNLPSCKLKARVNGGNGGIVNDVTAHGGGGGGGLGAIFLSTASPLNSDFGASTPGSAGKDCSGSSCGTTGTAGSTCGTGNCEVFTVGIALPVVLVEFKATLNKGIVLLNWTTAMEKDTKSFEIERTTDFKTIQKIATIEAKGNSSNLNQYVTKDNNLPQGLVYYRLRIVNQDNSYDFSKWEVIDYQSFKTKVKTFPNPVTDILNIVVPNSANTSKKIFIYNLQGLLIWEGIFFEESISISQLKHLKGLHLLKIISDNQVSQEKLLFQ